MCARGRKFNQSDPKAKSPVVVKARVDLNNFFTIKRRRRAIYFRTLLGLLSRSARCWWERKQVKHTKKGSWRAVDRTPKTYRGVILCLTEHSLPFCVMRLQPSESRDRREIKYPKICSSRSARQKGKERGELLNYEVEDSWAKNRKHNK